jgi:hypothetical protein
MTNRCDEPERSGREGKNGAAPTLNGAGPKRIFFGDASLAEDLSSAETEAIQRLVEKEGATQRLLMRLQSQANIDLWRRILAPPRITLGPGWSKDPGRSNQAILGSLGAAVVSSSLLEAILLAGANDRSYLPLADTLAGIGRMGEPLGAAEYRGEEAVDETEPGELVITPLPDTWIPAPQAELLRRVEYLPFSLMRAIAHRPEELRLLQPRQFEHFVGELLEALMFDEVKITPQTKDGGRDIVAVKRVDGFPIIFAVECKHWREDRPVDVVAMRTLLGTIEGRQATAHCGMLVTSSRFTADAIRFTTAEPRLSGRDYGDLVRWISEYDQLQQLRT